MAEASAEPQYPLNDVQSDKLRRQLDVWRKQLIAMNRSQRQVYFEHTRSASLELIAPAPDVIAGLLDSGPTRLFSMVPDALNQPEAPETVERWTRYSTNRRLRSSRCDPELPSGTVVRRHQAVPHNDSENQSR